MELNDKSQIYAIEKANEIWNEYFKNNMNSQVEYDDWLDMFQKEIDSCDTPIIDLGCGKGNDTLYLFEKGKEVIPCDYSINAIQNICKNFPQIKRTECFDMAKGFPFEDNFTKLIICDLSLHYFTEKTTFDIINEIKRVLKPNGILLLRLNSINDVNHGAGEGREIETHLYETNDGRYKRFFDKNDIERFFSDWDILKIQEETMSRYDKEKVLWKCEVKKQN